MKRDKVLKSVGMSLFVMGSFLFIALSFFSDINFSNSDLYDLTEEKHQPLANEISKIEPAPPFLMVGKLSKAFDDYDQSIKEQKGIAENKLSEVKEKLNGDPAKYTEQFVNKNFDDKFVKDKLKEYTGWMMNRSWDSFNDFEKSLDEKVAEVNDAVAAEYGIDSQKEDLLIAQVMQKGAAEWLKTGWMALLIFGMAILGGLVYAMPLAFKQKGIQNNHIYHNKSQTRHYPAVIVFVLLVVFYIILYEFPAYLANQIVLLRPLADQLAGTASDRWFLYGFLYTISMVTMGFRMMLKYRGNAYQQVRTVSVMFFQVAFAFMLPQIMTSLQLPSYDLKSIWPLEYSFFFDYRVDEYLNEGTLGIFLFGWGIALFAIGVPVLTYFYGKRWYCSWVCGCGGLAETVGDPYRHLSDKRLGAWQIERWLVHGVLVFAVFMTIWVAYTTFSGTSVLLGINSYDVRSVYGFAIGFVFAGAVGTGFYPVMGNRVWCRFGCPLAAYLGLVQRFKSRFRITTNGGQCISCGNCSTYCEMGIDVRWYAQRGQNIVRSSCVGCGVCSAVCPRGVLKLENKDEEGRINDDPILIGREGATLNL